MTNKERLDAIKDRAMFNQLAKRTGEITHSLVTLDEEDYDWLIEQAERVRWLEENLRGMHVFYAIRLAKSDELEKQNKRYREALESILNNDQMYITNEEIILKALEESS